MISSTLPPSLSLNFCGLHFHSPLILLSGSIGFGNEYTRIEGFSYQQAGAVVLNGTTRHARRGYSGHRLNEASMGLLSATGWPNPGVDRVVKEVLPSIEVKPTHLCANVCSETPDDFVEVTRRFNDSSVAAIELNMASIDSGAGALTGEAADQCARIVAACRSVTTKPLITKLPAHVDNMGLIARHCIEAGTDAISLINPVAGMAINIESRKPVLGHGIGGLSGPAIKPIAILKVMQVAEVARTHGVAVIGQGGVRSAEDAIEFLIAGADAVGICTGLYYDPLICQKINSGIDAYLKRHGLTNVAQLLGSLQSN